MSGPWGPGHSVLLAPVPALEPFVRERTAHYDPAWLSHDPRFVHAHITVLGPFLPREELTAAVLDTLAREVAATAAADLVLEEVATFPNGVVHLLPRPAAPLRGLTDRLVAAFPQCPPYAGDFPDPVPHLTLDLVHDDVTEASTRAAVSHLLPAAHRLDRVQLTWWQAGRCEVLHEWATAGPPA